MHDTIRITYSLNIIYITIYYTLCIKADVRVYTSNSGIEGYIYIYIINRYVTVKPKCGTDMIYL